MRLKFRILVLFLFIFLFGFVFSKNALAANFQLSGSVKDNNGIAIVGATVDVYTPGTTTDVVSPTTSGQDGSYNFTSVPQGTYDVKVTPPSGSNFSSAIALSQNISADTTLNFILVSATSVKLSGTVYDSTGIPLAGASVLLQLQNGSVVSSLTTGSAGTYSFTVSTGTYHLQFQNSSNTIGNYPYHYSFALPDTSYSQSTIQNINMPAKRVSIHVQNQSGTSVGNVALSTGSNTVFENNLNIGGGVIVSGTDGYTDNTLRTDGSGNATMWLFPGTNAYTIIATPPGGIGLAQTVFSNNVISGDTSLTLTMQPTITIGGTVYDAKGLPLSGASVTLQLQDGSTVSSMTTGTSGAYSFQTSSGTYHILFQNSSNTIGNYPYHYSFTIPDTTYTQSINQNVTIPASQVSIHVQDGAGTAIGNVALSTGSNQVFESNLNIGGGLIVSGTDGYTDNTLRTDATGNATMWLFPGANAYSIIATPPGGQGLSQTTFNNNVITGNTNLTLTLQRSITISGTIFDATGLPLQGASVNLQLTNGSQVASVTSNSSGFYSFQTSAGTYHLLILNSDNSLGNYPYHYSLALPDTTYSATVTQNVNIPAKKISVHVQDPAGLAVSNVILSTGANTIPEYNLAVGGGINASGTNGYVDNTLRTDSSGNATMWLFPGTNVYTILATPASSNTIYSPATLNNILVSSDQTELISLQYNHATPTTTATLSPVADTNGNYTDPTTVTLSATAASGYTVANTYYTLDGGSQQTYTAPFTVSGNGSHTITYWSVDNSGVPENLNTKSFTILTSYALSGTVFNDTVIQNGFQDPGETGVSGATITVTSGQFSTSTTTDANGNYSFTGLTPGTYIETLTVPNGDIATTTNPATISLSSNTTQNFGVAPSGPTLVAAINAGGDTQGAYLADTDYTGGSPYSSSSTVDLSGVTNPAPQAVYQTVRFGNSFSYTIPGLTPNGTYTVRLHFNELYWNSAGTRVFNVAINNSPVLSNFDIYQTAGGANKAITEQFPATPDANGNVTISFTTVTDNAMVNGIELYSGTLPSPTPTPTPTPATSAIINAGGATVGSFQADNSYNGGTVYSSTASVDTSNVTSPAPQAVYQSVRYGNFTYNVSNLVPNTNFLVRLHFNELYWTSAGSRVFNVAINGQQVLSNFDIFQAAGGANKAVVEDFVRPSDSTGKISIQFTTVTDNAAVSGIEIIPATVPTPTYFTANNGTDFARLTTPFISGVATQAVNADSSIALNVTNTSTYADSGFVLYEGTLGNLPNFTTVGTGDGYGLNLWFDTSNNNEFFAWDSNGILTGLDGDTYGLSNGSQNGVENINGTTNFFLMSDGQNHTLADLKNGVVPGIDANTKVAVWLGVNTSSGSTSSTIQSVNGL